jgi:hypothetical protein
MRSGDHICVDRGTFLDHGIYISREQVIHLSGGPLPDGKDSVICSITLDEFAPGGWNSWVGVVNHRDRPHFSYVEVIERATSQLGKHACDLKDPGSEDPSREHFATWCATGESFSDQVSEGLATAALSRP